MTLLLPIYRALESEINRHIVGSSEATQQCRQLQGKRLHLHLEDLSLTVQISALRDGIAITPETERADAVLTGRVKAFVDFVGADDGVDSELHIEGSAGVVQGYQKLFQSIRLSLHEVLQAHFGDVIGGSVADAVTTAKKGMQKITKSIRRNIDEYTYEKNNKNDMQSQSKRADLFKITRSQLRTLSNLLRKLGPTK